MQHTNLSRRRRGGFTLVEAMVAMVITGVIFAAVMDFFIVMSRTSVAASSAMYASADSNRVMNHIISLTREAKWIALPDDTSTTFTAPGSYTAANFETTFNSYSVDSGIEIMFPAGGTSPTVALSTGTYSLPVYDRSTDGNYLYIYRSNADGTPNASGGTCLWEYGTDGGVAVNKAVITSIASVPNAVQFARPQVGTTVEPYEVEIKIVSSYYSPISGNDSSESTNGSSVTTLTGKCVLLRDHELTTAHDPAVGSNSAGPHWSAN